MYGSIRPIPSWANPETYVPPIGTPEWYDYVQVERAGYEDWKQRNDRGARHMSRLQLALGGAAGAAGALGAGAAGAGGIAPSVGGGFGVPGMGLNVANMGLRAGVGSLLTKGLDGGNGGGEPGGGMAVGGSLLEQLAAQMMQQTGPLREMLLQRSGDFMQNGVGNSPQFSAFKASAEPQFNMARDNIISSTAPGGGLTAALAKLQTDKARMLTEAQGGIHQQELGLAERLATGGTGQAVSAFGTAGGLNNQRDAINAQSAQAESAQEMAILSALGQGAGAYFGSKD